MLSISPLIRILEALQVYILQMASISYWSSVFSSVVVDHAWRRTSASLHYEGFHGHQVKLK